MMKRLLTAAWVILLSAGVAQGQTTSPAPTPPADLAKPLAAFVDDQTIFAAHVDLGRIDLAAWAAAARTLAQAAGADEKEAALAINLAATAAKPTLDRLGAAGATHAYFVFGLNEAMVSPGAVIIPMASAEKAQAVIKTLKILESTEWDRAEVIGTTAVFSNDAGLSMIRKRKGNRPDIAEAFASAGDGAAHAMIIPSPELRKLAADLMPEMPKELGGGSTEGLLKGLQHVAMSVAAPPKLEVRIRVAAADAEAAGRTLTMLKAFKAELARLAEVHAKDLDAIDPKLLAQVAELLMPKLDGAGLTLVIQEKDFLEAAKAFRPLIADDQGRNIRAQATVREREIILACIAYAARNKDEWPASLEELQKAGHLKDGIPKSPVDGAAFTYRRPTAEQIKKVGAWQVPVLWEAAGVKGWRAVGFADGHVEMIAERDLGAIWERGGLK